MGFLLLSLQPACSGLRRSPLHEEEQGGRLVPGRVAEVGSEAIPASLVTGVASATRGTPESALSRIVADTLFGLEAERALSRGVVQGIRRATLARALLEQLKAAEQIRGPLPAQDEARLLKKHWADVDRPPAARVTHAVVVVSPAAEEAAAQALAESIRTATSSATTSGDFQRRAQAVPALGLSVRVEPLPPVAADGRVVPKGNAEVSSDDAQQFDLEFSRAANALTEVGQHSPVVRSRYGYHVIRLDERLPGLQLSPAEREKRLKDAFALERVERRVQALLASRQREVQLERSARELTRKIDLKP